MAKKSKKRVKDAGQISQDVALRRLADVEKQMFAAADRLDFEAAIALRQEWHALKKQLDEKSF